MIIKKENIVYFCTRAALGQELYFNRIRMHKPTGVVFQATFLDKIGTFKFFTIGALNDKSELEEKQVFDGKTDKSFFEAVSYFEKLISDRIPKKKTPPQSIGTFTFSKGKDGLITIPGMPIVKVLREDLEKVFTPPQTKPYGRLDMTAVDKPEYKTVDSKFALSYNEEATKALIGKGKDDDYVVYDMTPYASGGEQSGENGPAPEGVNQEQLTLDKIEGEKQENMKGSQTDKSEEKGSGDADKSDKGEKTDGDKGDQKGDGKSDGKEEGDKGDGEKGDGEGKASDEDSKPGSTEGDAFRGGKDSHGQRKDFEDAVMAQGGDFEKSLNEALDIDIVSKYRKQERLISSLNAWSEDELKTLLYPKLGMPTTVSKQTFIEKVQESTKQYFKE